MTINDTAKVLNKFTSKRFGLTAIAAGPNTIELRDALHKVRGVLEIAAPAATTTSVSADTVTPVQARKRDPGPPAQAPRNAIM